MAATSSDHLVRSANLSSDLEGALRAEYDALSRRATEHRRRAETLERLAEQALAQAAADEHLLNELASALGLACQLRIEQLDRRLRGQRLQEVAVEILASRVDVDVPVHY